VDSECRSLLADRFLQLSLPPDARRKIILVKPYAKARSTRIGAVKETAFQFARSFGIRA
jgi:hypothetical protein